VTLDGDGPLGCTRMLLSKPVIAAIGGFCVAGGFELALWADLRIVEEDATMGCFERRWGVPLVDGGTYRLPRIVGVGRALDIMMTGRPVKASEALAIGLATEVVPNGQARARAIWLGRQLAAFPQVCLREDRLSLYEGLGLGLMEGLRRETERGLRTIAADEPRSGATRFAGGAGRHGAQEPPSR
jgi:enoyl-CoA hydratase